MNALHTKTQPRPHLKTSHKNLAWVLAAVNEMIEESMYHCQTFGHTLQAHHNPNAARIFDSMLPHFESEQSFLLDKLPKVQLPSIPPWEIPHQEYEHPAMRLFQAHYLMTEAEAWKLMGEMIQVHTCFYNQLLEELQQDEIRELLQSLQKHCQICREMCKQQSLSIEPHPEDLDPPNIQG